jgi:late competence protein required for DNA uptake (superfamily II DNA/RNA helicase)
MQFAENLLVGYSLLAKMITEGIVFEGKQKRKRVTTTVVSVACDRCRTKRIKCDGKHPCATCTKYNEECTFSASRKKRGPLKGKKGI